MILESRQGRQMSVARNQQSESTHALSPRWGFLVSFCDLPFPTLESVGYFRTSLRDEDLPPAESGVTRARARGTRRRGEKHDNRGLGARAMREATVPSSGHCFRHSPR
jgi:hypothetical protein